MDKIGIITLNGDFNYGNRLQNFALQYILKNKDISVDTIIVKETKSKKIKKELLLGEISNTKDLKYVVNKIARKLTPKSTSKRLRYKKMQKEKYQIIHPFTRKYISSINIEKKDLKKFDEKYKLFIVGSDQVWNPNIIEFDTTHFLAFTSYQKRYSYSASIGVASIPEVPTKLKNHYKHFLSQMKYISVREHAGASIVKEIINKEVDIAPDPTLLLEKEEWLNAFNLKKNPEENYILLYFISGISVEIKKAIDLFAEQKKLKVIQIMGDLYDDNHIIVSPDVFIQLINDAHYFFTDSFHGTVFSIIMETNFLTFDRADGKGINSRIETLLEKFNLPQLLTYNSRDIFLVDQLNNFDNVKMVHQQEKKRGIKIISNNILKHLEEQ